MRSWTKGEGKFGEADEAGSGPSISAWKIRREKFSICLDGSTLQKLRKSWRPVKWDAAVRMRSMSSQPSGHFGLLLDTPLAANDGVCWGVGVKAGLVKKNL